MSFLVIHRDNKIFDIEGREVQKLVYNELHSSANVDRDCKTNGPFIQHEEYVYAFGEDLWIEWKSQDYLNFETEEWKKRKKEKLKHLNDMIKKLESK